jgi:hypothetical protein
VRSTLGITCGTDRVEEAPYIEEERGRRREHLDVARPAETFIALRAVGRHVQEVAAQPPHDVLVQFVHERVRGVEPAGALHVAVHHDGRDVGGVDIARPAVDLRVSEAMEGELRLPFLDARSRERVAVRRGGGAQRTRAEFAVLEDLRVAQRDDGTGGPGDADPQPSHEILTEIEHRPARRGRDDLGDAQLLRAAHEGRHAGAGDRHRVDDRGGRPCLAEADDRGRARGREARVVLLARVQPAGRDRGCRGGPGSVGRDAGLAAVRVFDDEQRRDARLLGVLDVRIAAEPVVLCGPGTGRANRDGVRALRQERRDIGRLVHRPHLVRRPARLHDLIVDVRSVDRRLIHADGARIEGGTAHLAVHVELVPGRERPRRGLRIRERDRLRGPLAIGEEARDDAARRAPRGHGSVGARDAHAQLDLLARGERREGPRDADRLAARDLEAVHAVAAAQLELDPRLRPPRHLALGDPADRRGGVRGVVTAMGRVDARHNRYGHCSLL